MKVRKFTYVCTYCRMYHSTVYCNKKDCNGVIIVRGDGSLMCRKCGAVDLNLDCPNCDFKKAVVVK